MAGERIVVGVDGSASSARALQWALAEAKLRSFEVRAVYVWHIPSLGFGVPLPMDLDLDRDGEAILRQTLEDAGPSEVPVEFGVQVGLPVPILIAEADAAAAPMIVVGSRGRGGFSGLLVGSVSSALAQHPHQPLVVCRPGGSPPDSDQFARRVVVGVDGSAGGARALRWAADEARLRGVELNVVLAAPPGDARGVRVGEGGAPPAGLEAARSTLAEQVGLLGSDPGVAVSSKVVAGHPAEVLLSESEDAGLLVVGTRGLGAIKELVLGSTSHAVLHHGGVPLAIIPNVPQSSH